MKLNIIILAAGEGKRMNSSIPKVMHKVGEKSMIGMVFSVASSLDPDKIIIIYGKSLDLLKKEINNNAVWIHQNEQLGTGHAVLQALPYLDENAKSIILYGDVPLITKQLLDQLILSTNENSIGIITTKLDNPEGFGRIIKNTNDKIIKIVEQKDATNEEVKIKEINSGIIFIKNKLLKKYLPILQNKNCQNEYYLTDIISYAANENLEIVGIEAKNPHEVQGVNDKFQLSEVYRIQQKLEAKKLLQKGLLLLDPDRFDLRGNLEAEQDVTIDTNVIISGEVFLGKNSFIETGVLIKNSKIGKNVHIKPYSIIEDAIIEDDCVIGPFARIRPKSIIKSKAKIGNFVEIKNTEVGFGSKANHLSYLGDSLIGQNVNIGAGTITCNYDGVHKYKTVIEDGAFIGSNCQIVAPVTIGKNATIGAGSTITENAPPDTLTLGRARQCTVKSWVSKKK